MEQSEKQGADRRAPHMFLAFHKPATSCMKSARDTFPTVSRLCIPCQAYTVEKPVRVRLTYYIQWACDFTFYVILFELKIKFMVASISHLQKRQLPAACRIIITPLTRVMWTKNLLEDASVLSGNRLLLLMCF
jgi:hypothetical protein